MAKAKIKLVQGDTRPLIVFSIEDKASGQPVDLSNPGTTIEMHFRMVGSNTLKETLPMVKAVGRLLEDDTLNVAAPYDVPGAGGRCFVEWSPTSLNTVGEFEGEIQVSFNGGGIQTVYDVLKFSIRKQFD